MTKSTEKLCRLCGQIKQRTEFHRARNGINAYCKPCANAKTQRWREENQDKLREYNLNWRPRELRRLYGMTVEQYWEIVRAQNGQCAICGDISSTFTLHIDHCHKSGKVRGLLCPNCNRGIGFLKDSKEILKKAITYLGRV